MNIYVGNLNYKIEDESLKGIFEEYGEVTEAKVVKDRATQRSKGFGFVTMADEDEARTAIQELDGKDVMGRNLKVNPAKGAPERSGGGEGGYRSSGRKPYGNNSRGGYGSNRYE